MVSSVDCCSSQLAHAYEQETAQSDAQRWGHRHENKPSALRHGHQKDHARNGNREPANRRHQLRHAASGLVRRSITIVASHGEACSLPTSLRFQLLQMWNKTANRFWKWFPALYAPGVQMIAPYRLATFRIGALCNLRSPLCWHSNYLPMRIGLTRTKPVGLILFARPARSAYDLPHPDQRSIFYSEHRSLHGVYIVHFSRDGSTSKPVDYPDHDARRRITCRARSAIAATMDRNRREGVRAIAVNGQAGCLPSALLPLPGL